MASSRFILAVDAFRSIQNVIQDRRDDQDGWQVDLTDVVSDVTSKNKSEFETCVGSWNDNQPDNPNKIRLYINNHSNFY